MNTYYVWRMYDMMCSYNKASQREETAIRKIYTVLHYIYKINK